MTRRSLAVLPLLLLLLLPLLPAKAAARTLLPDRATVLDWSRGPDPEVWRTVTRRASPVARVRLLTLEIVPLPAHAPFAALPIRRPFAAADAAPAGAEPLVMPLPGAMPLLLGALAGLAIIGRRRARPACPA